MAGLWMAVGHHRNGVLLGAISASLIAAAVGQRPLDPLSTARLKDFSPDRFQQESVDNN
jgi:glycine oxidase